MRHTFTPYNSDTESRTQNLCAYLTHKVMAGTTVLILECAVSSTAAYATELSLCKLTTSVLHSVDDIHQATPKERRKDDSNHSGWEAQSDANRTSPIRGRGDGHCSGRNGNVNCLETSGGICWKVGLVSDEFPFIKAHHIP